MQSRVSVEVMKELLRAGLVKPCVVERDGEPCRTVEEACAALDEALEQGDHGFVP